MAQIESAFDSRPCSLLHMKRDWDKLRRYDRAKGPNPIDAFKPRYSRKFLKRFYGKKATFAGRSLTGCWV